MDTHDFKLTTPRDVAVYVSTLFTLTRRANTDGKVETVLFLAEQLRGMVPDSVLSAFLRELRLERIPIDPPAVTVASSPVDPAPTPAPTAPTSAPSAPASTPEPTPQQYMREVQRSRRAVAQSTKLAW